ncbi:MAG: hypothetical protein JO276_01275 [Sphingomonadaceae bacterium]|nr:hypothetical protein [Sphingomonadaceae bacterium]
MPTILEQWEVLPHGPLVEVDDGILTVAGEIAMPLGRFPRRMTVVALTGGRTAIYSAIALDEPEMARIEKLGRPAILIVPGDAHRMDAPIWKQRYPELRVVAPPGARERVAEVVPVDATTSDILDDRAVDWTIVPGTGGHEGALTVRRPSGVTIVCNDLIANVAHPKGIGVRIMGRLMGFGLSEPQVPRTSRHMFVDDPEALAGQFRAWAAEPALARVIVSHGDVIEEKPREVLLALAASLDG